MPARFFCKTGAFAGSSFEVGEEATIGRRSEEAITLASDVVSGQHARIFRDGGRYFLEDLGSSNGTRLDGVEVEAPVRLDALHVVTFADQIDFIYQELPADWLPPQQAAPTVMHTAADDAFAPLPPLGTDAPAPGTDIERTHFGEAFTPMPDLSAEPEPGPSETPTLDSLETPPIDPGAPDDDVAMRTHFGAAFTPMPDLKAPAPPDDEDAEQGEEAPAAPGVPEDATVLRPAYVPTAVPDTPQFVLNVQRVGAEAETFVLVEGEQVVGRSRECEITLDDHSVSRRHAVLTVRDGAVTVRDLGSKNRTRLNGEEIADEITLMSGAVLRFGLQIEAVLAHT